MLYFRQAHTKNEITQYYATIINEYDIPIKVRGRRRPTQINFVFDDFSRCYQRNWKKYRKTQWKPKGLT